MNWKGHSSMELESIIIVCRRVVHMLSDWLSHNHAVFLLCWNELTTSSFTLPNARELIASAAQCKDASIG